jgi:nonribosomal peptide synthetase DhbF
VPSAFVAMARFPTTANGKLDPAALPPPGPVTRPDRVPASGPVETLIADVWLLVLDVAAVGADDNFF